MSCWMQKGFTDAMICLACHKLCLDKGNLTVAMTILLQKSRFTATSWGMLVSLRCHLNLFYLWHYTGVFTEDIWTQCTYSGLWSNSTTSNTEIWCGMCIYRPGWMLQHKMCILFKVFFCNSMVVWFTTKNHEFKNACNINVIRMII